jgi:predicted metal-binding membrane protein
MSDAASLVELRRDRAIVIAALATLTIFVLAEKVTPAGRLVARAAGVALIVWGACLIAAQIR